ncbi:DMT family transporter [Streptomyces sp. I05A-00742]|uniref:EamA family transporter n=1 Tax=Streptomyces sp. I05A-00742 TaxID=2732853 RepID=UPI001489D0A1|nr:EamA family transporter [Streptomyces sp. I05A-00742]
MVQAVRWPRQGTAMAPALMLVQIASLQAGSAVAKEAYASVGPSALAGMRLFFSAAILWMLVRPSPRRVTAVQWRAVIPLGLVFAAMGMAYFQAISRLPIGVAATVELLGPLTLSIALSRRLEHLVVALLALAGVLLLTGPGASLSAAGLVLGGAAALCRAGYVVLSRRVGRLFPDWTGLALALACGACVLTPVSAVTDGVSVVNHPAVLLTGLLVALLSSLIPYALDMTVLRRIDARAFGVLLALSPAVAAAVGFLLLREQLTVRQLAAVVLVVLAGAWSVLRAGTPAAPEARPGTPDS